MLLSRLGTERGLLGFQQEQARVCRSACMCVCEHVHVCANGCVCHKCVSTCECVSMHLL